MFVLDQVFNGCLQAFRVIPKAAKAIVASWAKQSANAAAVVAMIDGELVRLLGTRINRHHRIAADSTGTGLFLENTVVVVKGDAIVLDEILISNLRCPVLCVPFPHAAITTFSAKRVATFFAVVARIPSERFNGLDDAAANARLFGKVATCFAGANAALLALGEFALRLLLTTAVAFEGKFGRMLLHRNTPYSGAKAAA